MASSDNSEIKCGHCRQVYDTMKRCTRCKHIYYCSRDCQISDWSRHKDMCITMLSKGVNKDPFADVNTEFTEKGGNLVSHHRIKFEKAENDLKMKSKSTIPPGDMNIETVQTGNFYYCENEKQYNVQVFQEDLPFAGVYVKCDKLKRKINVNKHWTGAEIYKYLSGILEIPLEKIRIIHKGKIMTTETISDTIVPKAVFQVLGEKSASDQGLDKQDIEVMMKQLGIERNSAINTLRQKGDLIDAIIEAANKL